MRMPYRESVEFSSLDQEAKLGSEFELDKVMAKPGRRMARARTEMRAFMVS